VEQILRSGRLAALAFACLALSACGGGGGGGAGGPSVPPVVSGVSGMFDHGSTITITGTGFGTKSPALPMLYDNFDDATGDIVNTAGGGREPQVHAGALAGYNAWVRDGGGAFGSHAITRSNAMLKNRSTWHARMNFDSDLVNFWGLNFLVNYTIAAGDQVYFSYFYRFTRTSASYGRQTKSWIVYDSSFSNKAYWNAAFGNCQADARWRHELLEGGVQDANFGSSNLSSTDIDGEWVRMETYIQQSTPNTADGTQNVVVYRPTAGPARHDFLWSNKALRETSAAWSQWTFGGAYYDDCTGGETATIDLDEFYMDSTPARVELCDASTWAARSHCELAIPTGWSTTSITAILWAGHFGSGQTAYLYVVNPSGLPSASGIAVTIP
jgi:hypothetical protein